MVNEWGNPASGSFRKKFIRRAHVGKLVSVWVHAEIVHIVNAILRTAVQNGIVLPEELDGVGEYKGKLSPEAYGLSFQYVEGMEFEEWGFKLKGERLAFSSTIDEARRLSELAESMRVIDSVTQEPQHPEHTWQTCRPGARLLEPGDKGDDVQFVQLVLNCPEQDGIYGHQTRQCVLWNQKRWNLPQTGRVDGDFWGRILPRPSRFALQRSDSGLAVRALQAAIVAYSWNDALRISGHFDRPTDHAVRLIQQEYGLRVSGKVRSPEWAVLFGKPLAISD